MPDRSSTSHRLQESTLSLLRFLDFGSLAGDGSLVRLVLSSDSSIDRLLKHLMHTLALLGTAFNVRSAHALSDLLALLGRHGSQALGAQQFDAGALVAEVGLAADQHERGLGAEVEDFGVPLPTVSVVELGLGSSLPYP
jgi:hypothetical protein